MVCVLCERNRMDFGLYRVREGVQLEPSYLQECRDHLSSDVFNIDMDSSEAADRINSWVSSHTNGKIPVSPPTSSAPVNYGCADDCLGYPEADDCLFDQRHLLQRS